MTDRQTLTHWRLWRRVCATCGFRTTQGHLLPVDPSRLTLHARRVVEWAAQLALDAGRVMTLDDIRHAAYLVASGKPSSKVLNNAWDCTRVLALFRLMIDDSDLEAASLLSDRDGDQRRRLVWRIQEAAPHAYIDHICRAQFAAYSAPHWEDLPIADLQNLVRTLSVRTHRFHRPIPAARQLQRETAAAVADNEPF